MPCSGELEWQCALQVLLLFLSLHASAVASMGHLTLLHKLTSKLCSLSNSLKPHSFGGEQVYSPACEQSPAQFGPDLCSVVYIRRHICRMHKKHML